MFETELHWKAKAGRFLRCGSVKSATAADFYGWLKKYVTYLKCEGALIGTLIHNRLWDNLSGVYNGLTGRMAKKEVGLFWFLNSPPVFCIKPFYLAAGRGAIV